MEIIVINIGMVCLNDLREEVVADLPVMTAGDDLVDEIECTEIEFSDVPTHDIDLMEDELAEMKSAYVTLKYTRLSCTSHKVSY